MRGEMVGLKRILPIQRDRQDSSLKGFRDLLLVMLLVTMAAPAAALELFVDPAYGDTTPGWGGTAFSTISSAVTAAASDDIITLNPTTYTGASNKNITVNVPLTIRSANGTAETTIDLENSGRAFLFESAASESTVDGLSIINGQAPSTAGSDSEQGGAIAAVSADLTVLNSFFSENRANYAGGAIYGSSSQIDIRDCRFANNQVEWRGGAIALEGGGTHTIDSSVFENNHGIENFSSGGAINLSSSAVILRSSLFNGNTAGVNGGAIWFYPNSVASSLVNNTFVNNQASGGGGGMFVQSSGTASISVSNSIYWDNMASHGNQIYVHETGSVTVPIDYSIVQGGSSGVVAAGGNTVPYGANNLSSDPLFVSSSDFYLQQSSPARDSGTPTPSGGLSVSDVEGQLRVQNGAVDRGAYEYTSIIELPSDLEFHGAEFRGLAGETNPQGQTLSISNAGIGELAWAASTDCSWLTLGITSGSTTTETDEVALQVDIAGLASGSYSCDVIISSSNASNSPQTTTVNLSVGSVAIVPDDGYAAIQSAMDAVSDGDAVVVRDGVYTGTGNRDLDFSGKSITVRSENGPGVTVIDAQGAGRGFFLDDSQPADPVIQGFTIRNGRVTGNGGAIYAGDNSSPTIRDSVFESNTALVDPDVGGGGSRPASGNGGALFLGAGSTARLNNLAFLDNTAQRNGGGLYLHYARPYVTDTRFSGNHALFTNSDGGQGGAVFGLEVQGAVFEGNRFRGNHSQWH